MPLPRFIKSRAFVYSVGLHVAIIVLLVVGVEPASKLAPISPNQPLMEAKAVNLAAIEAEKKRKAEIVAAQKMAQEKKLADEKKRKAAEEEKRRQQKLEEEQAKRKKEQQEKELAEAQARKKAEAEKLAAQKKALEEKKREEELKRKKEAEALKAKQKAAEEKAAKEKAEAEARQKALDEALAEEERALAEAAQAAADEREIAKYIRAVANRVTGVFLYPPGLEEGMSCTLYVRMIPGGEVIEARVTKSSGNATFDRQAENAVRKASPLPVPDEPRLFNRMREIQFVFDPSN